MRICIPIESDAGTDSPVYGHFGSAPAFAVYDADSNELQIVSNSNEHHEHGACQPVSALSELRIDAVVCRGMGVRAAQNLRAMGMNVYFSDAETVGAVADHLRRGLLREATLEGLCGGHGSGGCGSHHG